MTNYICPKCIQKSGGSYVLTNASIGFSCPQCLSVFPVIDETPILVADLEEWFFSQREMVLLRTDLSSEIYEFILQFQSPIREVQKQLYSYLSAPKGTLHNWLTEQLTHQTGRILDLGCGIGLHTRSDIIGVDTNWILLQRYPGKKIIADIMNPPFPAHSFDCILLLNVIDSCTHPFLLLQQADALVKKNGRIIFSSPFSWKDSVTSPTEQLSSDWVYQFWIEKGYNITEEENDWFVQSNPRSQTQYKTICWNITRFP